eukprot:TRINITY_DN8169_c0_g2_i1.p1 TRINITY_DN8169_c0_g2~~TRINITY_DN8169_c0_g2_i1.p1  ORF type:complete len:403 (+),score=39.26 TRINITY_DN8169_c0_g2_i1:54-1262(+)
MSFDELSGSRSSSDPKSKLLQPPEIRNDYYFDFSSLGDVYIVMVVHRIGSGVMLNWHSAEEGLKFDSNVLSEIIMAHQQLTGFPERCSVSIHGFDIVVANRNNCTAMLVSNLLHRSQSLRTWTVPFVSQLADTFEIKYPEAIKRFGEQQEIKMAENERLASDGILADVMRALSSLELTTLEDFASFSDVIKEITSDTNYSIPGAVKQLSEATNSLLALAYVQNPYQFLTHRWNPTLCTDASHEFGPLLARYHPVKGIITNHVVSVWDSLSFPHDTPVSLQFTERNSGKQIIVTGVNKSVRCGDLSVTATVLVFLSPLIPRTTRGGLSIFSPAFQVSLPLSYEKQDNTKSAATTILKKLSLSNEQTPEMQAVAQTAGQLPRTPGTHNPLTAPPREREDQLLSL